MSHIVAMTSKYIGMESRHNVKLPTLKRYDHAGGTILYTHPGIRTGPSSTRPGLLWERILRHCFAKAFVCGVALRGNHSNASLIPLSNLSTFLPASSILSHGRMTP